MSFVMNIFIPAFSNYGDKGSQNEILYQTRLIGMSYRYKLKHYHGTTITERKSIISIVDYYSDTDMGDD